MNKYTHLFVLLCLALGLFSCRKENPENQGGSGKAETYYINMFAFNTMNIYYLWNEEIEAGLGNWKTNEPDPIAKVQEIRYKDSNGKDIDKWTVLTDDFESFSSSVAGISTTYGFDYMLAYGDEARKSVVGVVTLTYADSPARKAGLKRGDIFVKVNGVSMTADNYAEVLTKQMIMSKECTLTLANGSTTTKMTAVNMYEDPVLLSKVFDCGSKKVGYLFYNSFTQDSYKRLLEEFRALKDEGIKELILDLRYNGGGFVTTEYAIASILAPYKEVLNGSIFETEVYNKIVGASMDSKEVRFTTEFGYSSNGKSVSYSTEGYNLGIDKLYVIMTGSSASASESLVTGLLPYMDIEIIGEQSYGKYCSGMILSGPDWFDFYKSELTGEKPEGMGMSLEEFNKGKEDADNWGIYVMLSRYADKNGDTPCMPDGFVPKVQVQDVPYDGYQLGDPEETMLSIALRRAGYRGVSGGATKSSGSVIIQKDLLPFEKQIHRTEFGKLIIEPQSLPEGPISLK